MKVLVAGLASLALIFGLSACGQSAEMKERNELQNQSKSENSLELNNLKDKRQREDNPDATRYLYLMNYGDIVGYYVTKGKVSSSASQIAPEQDVIWPYSTSNGYVLDSSKDDGSYGPGDPGIFFFTADGVMVETSLDYIISDAPLAIDVPRLEGK
jgi:hypothetical protein